MTPRASIKDVARLSGVSASTVSNALNHPQRVKPERLARINKAMAALNYVRSEPARHLRLGRSSTIGLVLLDASNPGFMQMASGVEDALSESGLTVMMGNSRRDADRESRYLRAYLEQQAAGVVITPRNGTSQGIAALRQRGVPVVLLDRHDTSDGVFSVSVDDLLGGRLAAQHLVKLGHRHIVFVGSPQVAAPVAERFDGVQQGARDSQRAVHIEQIDAALTIEDGHAAGLRIAAMSPRPSAIIAAVDIVAFGILQALTQAGLRVPDDISLCGYDDTVFSAQLATALTSVKRPHYEIGAAAGSIMLALVNGTNPPTQHVRFSPTLVVRDSTGPAT